MHLFCWAAKQTAVLSEHCACHWIKTYKIILLRNAQSTSGRSRRCIIKTISFQHLNGAGGDFLSTATLKMTTFDMRTLILRDSYCAELKESHLTYQDLWLD